MATPLRFVRRRRRQPKGGATKQSAFFIPVGSQLTTSGEPFFTPAPAFVQTKLTVNKPGDAHEQEADKIADQVVQRSTMKADEEKVQRKGKHDEEDVQRAEIKPDDEKIQKKDAKEEETLVQKKSTAAAGPSAAPVSAHQLNSTKGQGSPLPTTALTEMSQAFGHDFRNVRIHTTSQAEELSHALQAQAFTHGKDVYFNAGKYNPETTDGKRLLAHELTHVVQQNAVEKDEAIQRQAQVVSPVAQWIAAGALGNAVVQNAVTNSSGDISYSFDEMEGVLLPGGGSNVQGYMQTHPQASIQEYTHTVSIWQGKSDSRKAGIKFGITFSYDGFAIGNVSMNILDTYDWPLWGGSVNVNITPISFASGGVATIRLTINFNSTNTFSDYADSAILNLNGRGELVERFRTYNYFLRYG